VVQQYGKRHAGPFAAAAHAMDELDRQAHVLVALMMDQGRAVGMALEEMHSGYRRQALELVHAEAQRTINQAVNREAMFLGIDLGKVRRVVLDEMEPGRCDDSRIVLIRSVVGDVIDAHPDATARGYPSRCRPILVQVSLLGCYFGLGCLATRPFSASA